MTTNPAPDRRDEKLLALTTLVLLESQARKQEGIDDLAFMMVNETYRLVPYRQCVFWQRGADGRVRIRTVSGLADRGEASPYITWLEGLIRKTLRDKDPVVPLPVRAADLPSGEDRKDWAEWCGAEALLIPFAKTAAGVHPGGLWCDREEAFSESEKHLLGELGEAYGHALDRLNRRYEPLSGRLREALKPRKNRLIAAGLVAAVLLFPVRLSVTAPAEIVPHAPFVIASPLDGVIEDILIEPNSRVKAGDPLIQIENTALENQEEIAGKALGVAQAAYARAAREAFSKAESKADVALLKADMEAKSAEYAYARELAALSAIKAPQAGIAIFSDKNALRGQPVQAGERIMLVADPADTEVMIRIPADRFLRVREDIAPRLFLNISPLRSLKLEVASVGYEPAQDADGLLTYKLRARFAEEGARNPGIGLKGTAKVYGDRTVLIYKVLRRPLAALRRMTGV